VNIDQFGSVQPNGSQIITLTDSTTYRLTAKGPGGVQERDVRVTVTNAVPEPPAGPEAVTGGGPLGRLDVFFDTDDSSIRPDQLGTIRNDAAFLRQHPEVHIVVEGHCDELGSTEYNLALGERRAWEVKAALEKAGISAGRIETISYGKEKPFCEEQSDTCWRMNRRAHIVTQVER
jgi:peptidoglycan-associated lipoprotein